MVKVSGNRVYQTKKYIETTFGVERYEKIVDKIPDESYREILKGCIISSQWYEFDMWENLILRFVDELGIEEYKKSEYYAAEKQMSGLFGIISRFVSIKHLLENAPKMWFKQFDQGVLKIILTEKGYRASVKGITFAEPLNIGFSAWMERFFELVHRGRFKARYKLLGDLTLVVDIDRQA